MMLENYNTANISIIQGAPRGGCTVEFALLLWVCVCVCVCARARVYMWVRTYVRMSDIFFKILVSIFSISQMFKVFSFYRLTLS